MLLTISSGYMTQKTSRRIGSFNELIKIEDPGRITRRGTMLSEVLWAENQPPSIFGSMAGKAMPKSIVRLANVSFSPILLAKAPTYAIFLH
jgi:hypothetical protein